MSRPKIEQAGYREIDPRPTGENHCGEDSGTCRARYQLQSCALVLFLGLQPIVPTAHFFGFPIRYPPLGRLAELRLLPNDGIGKSEPSPRALTYAKARRHKMHGPRSPFLGRAGAQGWESLIY